MNQGTSNNSGEQALQSVVQDTIHAHVQEIERLRTEVDAKDEEVKNQHQLLDALQRELEEKDRLISSGREQLAKNNSSISELHAILASATTAKDQDRLAITRLESELHSCIAEKARDRASFEDRLRPLESARPPPAAPGETSAPHPLGSSQRDGMDVDRRANHDQGNQQQAPSSEPLRMETEELQREPSVARQVRRGPHAQHYYNGARGPRASRPFLGAYYSDAGRLRHPGVAENIAPVLGVNPTTEGTNQQDRDEVSTRSPNLGSLNREDLARLIQESLSKVIGTGAHPRRLTRRAREPDSDADDEEADRLAKLPPKDTNKVRSLVRTSIRSLLSITYDAEFCNHRGADPIIVRRFNAGENVPGPNLDNLQMDISTAGKSSKWNDTAFDLIVAEMRGLQQERELVIPATASDAHLKEFIRRKYVRLLNKLFNTVKRQKDDGHTEESDEALARNEAQITKNYSNTRRLHRRSRKYRDLMETCTKYIEMDRADKATFEWIKKVLKKGGMEMMSSEHTEFVEGRKVLRVHLIKWRSADVTRMITYLKANTSKKKETGASWPRFQSTTDTTRKPKKFLPQPFYDPTWWNGERIERGISLTVSQRDFQWLQPIYGDSCECKPLA
jgi:hypothetical protein